MKEDFESGFLSKKKIALTEERSKHALKLIIKPYSPVPVTARSKALGLRPLAGWDYGCEFRRRLGCLPLVSVGCFQAEISATNWSLVQRSPTECGTSLPVIWKPHEWGGHSSRRAAALKKKPYSPLLTRLWGKC